MKYSIISILLVASVTSALHAESPFEREFKQLREQRDKTVAAAVDPINRKYQASLDQLLRRATQGNDLDTAIKLKAELQSLTTATATSASTTTPTTAEPGAVTEQKKRVREYLMKSQWRFGKHTLTFNKNDTASCSDGSIWPFKIKGPDVMLLQDKEIHITLDAETIPLPKFAPDGGDRTLVRLTKP